jgi:hypothetical protein
MSQGLFKQHAAFDFHVDNFCLDYTIVHVEAWNTQLELINYQVTYRHKRTVEDELTITEFETNSYLSQHILIQ